MERSSASAEQISLVIKVSTGCFLVRVSGEGSDLLRPGHAYGSVGNVGAEHLESEPFQTGRDCPDCENDGCDETPECGDGHERGTVAPVVGEDGKEDGEDELDSCLRGWNDVDQLDGIFAGGLEPEGEGLDAARGLL